MKKGIQHTATYEFPLDKILKLFKLKLDIDSYDDIHHDGYSAKQVLDMGLDYVANSGLENVEQLFPTQVAIALEVSEREAAASELRKNNLEALKQNLEKISTHVEYQDSEGEWYGSEAGVESAEIEEDKNLVKITIKNPEHLFNGITAGVGRFYPELPAEEKAESEEIISRAFNFKDYFDVYGESIVEPDDIRNAGVDDSYLAEEIKYQISTLGIPEIIDSMADAVENERLSAGDALKMAAKITGVDSDRIRQEAIKNSVLNEHIKTLATINIDEPLEGKAIGEFKSTNLQWGFYGEIKKMFSSANDIEVSAIFDMAANKLLKNGLTKNEVVEFLDATHGRHLADGLKVPTNYEVAEIALDRTLSEPWIKKEIEQFRKNKKRYED